MSEVDPLFWQVRYYLEPDYEITDPDAEATPEQLRAFFDKCVQLHSPAELDTGYLEEYALLARLFGEDEVEDAIVDMTQLGSADSFQVFGAYVDLNTYEAINRPEKTVKLSTYARMASDLGPALMVWRQQTYELEFNSDENTLIPRFEDETRIEDREKLSAIRRAVHETQGKPVPQAKKESFEEKIKRWYSEEPQIFTQARWLESMMLLDMIAYLKEYGVTNTDALDFD
jgi:hypothetical protein